MGFFWQSIPTPLINDAKAFLGNHAMVIETGTYLGDGASQLLNHFEHVITVELDDELAMNAALRFAGNERVEVIHSGSLEFLRNYVPKIDTPHLFWLDAHYSGGKTAGVYAPCPIIGEIQEIARSTVGISRFLILVDDVRCVGNDQGWPSWNELTSALEACGLVFNIRDDVMIIYPNNVVVELQDHARCISALPMWYVWNNYAGLHRKITRINRYRRGWHRIISKIWRKSQRVKAMEP